MWLKHTFCETWGLLHNMYVTNVVKSHRTWDWVLFHTLNTRGSATLLDHTSAWTCFVSCCLHLLFMTLKTWTLETWKIFITHSRELKCDFSHGALPCSYLVTGNRIKFRQQFDAVLPSYQYALQCLAVLLHLCEAQHHWLTLHICNLPGKKRIWISLFSWATCTWSSVKSPSRMR